MTKAGDHYVVPLPFGKESLEMPNNRKQAMKRLMHFKDRYTRNTSYFANYVKFMHDLITKGYTRKDNTRPPGKTWFIPHHGVYHSNNFRKISVVVDCSGGFDE